MPRRRGNRDSLSAAPAWAAAGNDLDEAPPAASAATGSPIVDYALDREIVVENWVLCVSQRFAEDLVHAREAGPDRAIETYADLKAKRSCGQFAELRVILQKRLYESSAASGHDARAFSALVNLSGSWANAFVVFGGVPEQ